MAETWRSEFDAFDQDQCEQTSRRRASLGGVRETYFAAGYQIGVNDTKAQPLLAAAPDMFALLESLHADLARYSKMTEEVWSSGSIALGSMADDCARLLAKARGEAPRAS